MILIGSKALECYIPDLGRVTHDWDILCSDTEFSKIKEEFGTNIVKETSSSTLFEIDGEIIEVTNQSRFAPSDFSIKSSGQLKMTPVGISGIAAPEDLYAIKRATAEVLEEPKHIHDCELMGGVPNSLMDMIAGPLKSFPYRINTALYNERLAETKERVGKSREIKREFFHEYHIPEYIYHDELHEMIADLLDIKLPTYIRTICADVERSEDLFNALTYEQKISLMVEESLVLALERWFIPQMIENGINYSLITTFESNNEGLPTYKILKHCNVTGLKGEAKWVTDFSKANFFKIEREWQLAKASINSKGGFPQEFYRSLFRIRNDYKQGKQVDKAVS